MARITPDNAFDLLEEDFNYYALFAVIGAVFVGDWVLAKVMKRRTIMREFLAR